MDSTQDTYWERDSIADHASRCVDLFRRSGLAVICFDSALRITALNQRVLTLLRSSRAKLLSAKLLDVVAVQDQKRVSDWLLSNVEGSDASSLDFAMNGSLGRCRQVQALVSLLPRVDKGPAGGMLFLADITRQKRKSDSLLQQAEFNDTLLNKTSALIVVYDTKGVVRHISRAVEKLFGYTNDNVRGKCIWKIGVMPPAEVARSRKRLRELKKGAHSIQSTMRLMTTAGELRTMEIISTAVPKPTGGVDCIIATGTDITERERLQQEVLRVAESEQARIGHDLHDGVGQSLTGIVALAEALEHQASGGQLTLARRIREQLQVTIREVRRLAHGMTPIAIRARELPEALMMLAETVRESFRTSCACEIDDRVGLPTVEVQIHLFRIAQEAVSNALRHGKARKVKMALRRLSPETCELRIQDDGIGFDAAGRDSRGIGLRVMKYRAEMIGGTLEIASKPRRGTWVQCSFPCLKKQK